MKTLKVNCGGTCTGLTTHAIVASYETKGVVAEYDVHWWENYEIVQCCGCEFVSFRKVSSSSEEFDPFSGEASERVIVFSDSIGARKMIEGHEHFPKKTLRAYQETLKAVNNALPLLAAIGLRTVIESTCLDQKVPGHNLQEKINQLALMGHLSQKQAEFLHNHRFMGNNAAHEIEAPDPTHIIAAIDIAETLLKTIYVLPHLAAKLPQHKGLKARKSKSP